MKNLILSCLILTGLLSNAQAFRGKGDTKFQVGMNIKNYGTGITATTDFGIGENMSYGFVAAYLLSPSEVIGENKPDFEDRVDLKARFSAHLGNVIKVDPKLDIYPGLNLGLRHFGGHVGIRYFLSEGFGLFSEYNFSITNYNKNATGYEERNNRPVLSIGASFNVK